MRERGFSLIELVISAAIMAIISAIVIVRFTAFDSSILLKSLAYEVAASIRDAQIYAVSIVNNSDGFDYPYGMTFSTAIPKSYTFFRDTTGASEPIFNQSNSTTINKYEIGRSMQIVNLCVYKGNVDYCTVGGSHPSPSMNRVDILFRRPEYRAMFNGEILPLSPSEITSAKIILNSTTDAAEEWEVYVELLGQVSVKKAP